MKALLINYGPKPLPAVYGGGVETLIQNFASNYSGNAELTIASYFDENALAESKKYTEIKFIYIRRTVLFKAQQIVRHLINKNTKHYCGNAFIAQLNRIVDFNSFDIIVSENGIELGMFIRKHYGGRLVLHLHNDYLNKFTKNANLIRDSFDEIWTLSEYVKRQVEMVPGKSTVKTLYNGVDIDKFISKALNSEKEQLLQRLGIKNNDFVFAYCGRIVEEKGIQFLIEAFNELSIRYSNIKLLVIGYCAPKNKVLLKSATDNIKFTGFVDYEEIPMFMDIANVGIAPTVHLDKYYNSTGDYLGVIEGFNLSVVEFMALGKPVIVSNSGGMPELINNDVGITISSNETDMVNELGKSMGKMMDDYLQYDSKKIENKAREFSLQKFVDKYSEYLEARHES